MTPLERLEELTDTETTIDNYNGSFRVYIRPFGGGFPLVKGNGETLSEAVKQAIELWETK